MFYYIIIHCFNIINTIVINKWGYRNHQKIVPLPMLKNSYFKMLVIFYWKVITKVNIVFLMNYINIAFIYFMILILT